MCLANVCVKLNCLRNRCMEKGPKTENVHVCFGLLSMKNASCFKKSGKTAYIYAFHIDKTPTQETSHRCTTQPHLTQILSVEVHFHNENGPVRTETLSHRKKWQPLAWATRRSRPRWPSAVDDKAVGGCAAQRHNAKHIINTHLTTPKTQATSLPTRNGFP